MPSLSPIVRRGLAAVALASAIASAACTTSSPRSPAAGGATTVEGTITMIDLQPWTYDGNGVVTLDAGARGRVAVQLPARWNLCQAAPVDVDALAVGMRVQAVGTWSEGALVVCEAPVHRLVAVPAAE